ncbi:MAG: cell division regulator GpsB [Lactobacillales bacterium]|jgi:DivIVA domain-containing protein|nr:cell division regulator GpsB [Lactobacillales bacterium]
MAEMNYTTQDILNQQFSNKMRGYDPEQVDEFLDNIILDYEAYMREILGLQEENARLQAKISNMTKVHKAVAPAANDRVSTSKKSSIAMNFDILKRLSNLERKVFGDKLAQETNVGMNFDSSSSSETEVFIEPEIDSQATRLV